MGETDASSGRVRGELVSKHSQQDQTLLSGGAGFKGHPWGLREPIFFVLEPSVVQKLYSGKVQHETLLWEEVGRCSRELPLLICPGVCCRRGIAVKQINSMNTPGRKRRKNIFFCLLTRYLFTNSLMLLYCH